MSLPIFLNIEQIMTVLLSELPEGVFSDDRADNPDPDLRSYSSSEIRAAAAVFETLYSNLQGIWEDKHLSTLTDDSIPKWESLLFTSPQDSSLSPEVRRANLITKFRATGGISYNYIVNLIHGILDPLGLSFDVVYYSGYNNGAWVLEVSELEVGTYLAARDPLVGARRDLVPLDCSLDYAAAGITQQDLTDIQTTAYTYEVRIYGTAPDATIALLDATLTNAEKAGSTHVIKNNYTVTITPGE